MEYRSHNLSESRLGILMQTLFRSLNKFRAALTRKVPLKFLQ
jgi:hypothetical protein